jgi:hypothetical protein
LTTQKRKDNREDDRVCQRRLETGLTRSEDTTRTRGDGQEKTRAEREEERGGHEQVGLGEHETHRLCDKAVHKEEDECVEEHRSLTSLTVSERHLGTVSGQENTGAECQKKSGGDGNFLGSDIGEHLIYAHIIFNELEKMIE